MLQILNCILQFLKDWVPTLGIIFGGGFAYWKWSSIEKLRKQREMPSADKGTLSITSLPINDVKVWVQIDVIWRNPGSIPFDVDVDATVISVFEIKSSIDIGAIQLKVEPGDLGEPIYSIKPYGSSKSVKYEPKSESLVQNHFVLERQKIYLFRWKLYRKTGDGKKVSRTRFIMLDANTLSTTTPIETSEIEDTNEV